jgi:hypothetical protein
MSIDVAGQVIYVGNVMFRIGTHLSHKTMIDSFDIIKCRNE